MDDYVGKKFGKLTVLNTDKINGRKVFVCKCDCGKITKPYAYNVLRGKTKSCGCGMRPVKNIIGKKFYDLVVVSETDERECGLIKWRCKCLKCGREILATKKQLDRGYVKDCGNHLYDDLIGKTIGDLKIIRFDNKKEKYECKCSCGETTYVERGNLLSRHTLSCGHLRKEKELEYIDGALPYMLDMKLSSANTSGYRGVSQTRSGSWVAYITLKGVRHPLGTYKDKMDAVKARFDAEVKLYKPILDKYESTQNKQ